MAEIHNQRPGVDPLLEANFRVDIEGLPSIGFKSVSEPKRSDATAKYRNGNDPNWHRKQRGLRTYDSITLERGLMEDETILQEWMDSGERKTVEILRLNHLTEQVTPYVRCYEAFPSTITHPKGDADSEDGVAIITIELEYEWFDDYEE
jgi:phage tail-like protein